MPVLQEFVLSILHQLKDSIDEVPFGIRWLCKATRSLVMEKFPTAELESINSFIGGFFFLRYINPIIATPHGKGGREGEREREEREKERERPGIRGKREREREREIKREQEREITHHFFLLSAYRLISNPPPHQTRRNLTLVSNICFLCARYIVIMMALLHSRMHMICDAFSANFSALQVVKVIQKLANTSHVRESYMKPLEPFVKAHNEELKVHLNVHCKS